MTTTRSMLTRTLVAAAAAALLSACKSDLGLNASASGEAQLLMQRDTSSAPLGSPAAAPQDSAAGSPRAVDCDTVDYFKVTVTGVDVLAAGASDTSATSQSWTSIQLGSAFDVDLNALPTTDAAAKLVASGHLAAGTYSRIRLHITNPRIRFKGDVSFGVAGILHGGTDYAVTLAPSQTTLTADVAVSMAVSGSAAIGLVFDGGQALGDVALTGTGQVLMSAVLRAR